MYYWPANFPREDTITVFIEVFKGLGFELCDSDDLEADFEKIALYGMWGQVKHAARQLADGHWTSKLGQDIDISHYTADAISGPAYGVVCQLMKRPKS